MKVSDEGKDFVTKMLNRDPKTRLGSKGESDEILAHPWFKELDK